MGENRQGRAMPGTVSVKEILRENELELAAPSIHKTELAKLAERREPNFMEHNQLRVIISLVLSIACAVFVVFTPELTTPYQQAGIFAFLLTMWCVVGYLTWRKAYRIQEILESLEQPFQELVELKEYVYRYKADFDARTSKYFHCVTNNKMTAYFVLNQIVDALEKRVESVTNYVRHPTADNVKSAYIALSGGIVFSDSFLQTSGETHMIPLSRLSKTVAQIIENLNFGLELLEDQIRVEPNSNEYLDITESKPIE